MSEEEIKECNRLIAEFMGYKYYHKGIIMDVGEGPFYKDFQEKEVFSKVPIESEDYLDQFYFKDLPNPDYGKDGNTRWNRDLEKLSWATLNWDQYIIELKYDSDWNFLMPVVEKIESIPGKIITVKIEGYICDIIQTKRDPSIKVNGGLQDIVLVSHKNNDKKRLIWDSVIEFIKLYNQEK